MQRSASSSAGTPVDEWYVTSFVIRIGSPTVARTLNTVLARSGETCVLTSTSHAVSIEVAGAAGERHARVVAAVAEDDLVLVFALQPRTRAPGR